MEKASQNVTLFCQKAKSQSFKPLKSEANVIFHTTKDVLRNDLLYDSPIRCIQAIRSILIPRATGLRTIGGPSLCNIVTILVFF